MDAEHLWLIAAVLLIDLGLSFGLMAMFGKWLVRNTRPKHGHCPLTCVCRKPGYVWPKRRSTDEENMTRRVDDVPR